MKQQQDSFNLQQDIQLSDLKNLAAYSHYDFNDQSLFLDQMPKQIPKNQLPLTQKSKNQNQQTLSVIQNQQSEVKKPQITKLKQQKAHKKQSQKKSSNKILHKRSNSSLSIVQRGQIWIQTKRKKVFQKQKYKNEQELKQCSFKPRVNSHLKNSRQYNNISNISSFSIRQKSINKNCEKQNVNNSNKDNNNNKIVPQQSLFNKWQQQILDQQKKIKQRLNKQPNKLFKNRHVNYYPQSKQFVSSLLINNNRGQQLKEYYELIMKADSLFTDLKKIKQQNMLLSRQART